MSTRKIPKILVLTLCMLLITVGTVFALSSPNFDVPINTLEGGGAGGQFATSANYQAIISYGGVIQTQATSANYEVCSGFLCSVEGVVEFVFNRVLLPLLVKNY